MSFLSLFLYFALPFIAQATVPPSSKTDFINEGRTFNFSNEGSYGEHDNEYGATYRTLAIFEAPFQLIFYNTTPNAFTLAIRMGVFRDRSIMRWVWEANRGNPVGENATFVLDTDGNLVLSDGDGRIAWQSNTANKGVVGFKLLPNGNLVLHDKKNNFIWQSFGSPTDTLLLGQPLKPSGPKTLVSRVSEKVNSNGPYSLVMDPQGLALYYKTKNSPTPYLYYSYADLFIISSTSSLVFVRVNVSSESLRSYGFDLTFEFDVVIPNDTSVYTLDRVLARPRYNSTLTYLRLGIDGNVKLHTYAARINVNDDNNFDVWEVTYSLFAKDSESECHMPERCGNFGICEDSQCVACPTPNGLAGWSKTCAPPKVSTCGKNNFHYYKIEGVDHFSSKYTKGDGPMKESACMNKCSMNCKCLGYFYHQTTSRCWAVNDLKTLTKVSNSTNVGYIKTPNL